MYEVLIVKIIQFDKYDYEIKKRWLQAVNDSSHLFSKKTDYFIYGIIKEINEELIFCRTNDNGWFSFNNYWYDGRLDIDGKLKEECNKRVKPS